MSISDPADCELRSVIRFLEAKNFRLDKIHRQLVDVYGEGIMNERSLLKWSREDVKACYPNPPTGTTDLMECACFTTTHDHTLQERKDKVFGEIWLGKP
jgi:hypothetical protein